MLRAGNFSLVSEGWYGAPNPVQELMRDWKLEMFRALPVSEVLAMIDCFYMVNVVRPLEWPSGGRGASLVCFLVVGLCVLFVVVSCRLSTDEGKCELVTTG